jgi:hypothetical protein
MTMTRSSHDLRGGIGYTWRPISRGIARARIGSTKRGMKDLLNPEKAYIFRITHRQNLPWIFRNGLHCRNANRIDPNFVSIGDTGLIEHRHHHDLAIQGGGSLSDYIPFYFTPLSMMAINIKTGYRGVTQRPNNEIVIMLTSLRRLETNGIPFLFTDRRAYLRYAKFYNNLGDLDQINWTILQNRDFSKDPEDPEKTDRYQAEALVRDHLPITSLIAVACYNTTECEQAQQLADDAGITLRIVRRQGWYF